MSDERAMLDLVGRIYAAVTDRELWPGVLESISDSYRGASIVLGKQSFTSGAHGVMTCRTPPGSFERFTRDFSSPEKVEFIRVLPDVALARPITPEQFEGEESFLASPVYQETMRPFGLRWMATSILYREPGWACFLTLARSAEAGPYTGGDLERLGWLCQHLARAMAIQNALGESDAKLRLLSQVVDRFDRAALVCDAAGRIRFANRAAGAILDRADGLCSFGGRVHPIDREDKKRLLLLIGQAARTSAGEGVAAGGALRIARREDRRPYAAIVSPMVATSDADGGERAALLLVDDPDRSQDVSCQRLADLHGLTPAEARVAARLLDGCTPAEAARALDVSLSTVRFHLRSLFAKTGTRRQPELLALLSSGGAA